MDSLVPLVDSYRNSRRSETLAAALVTIGRLSGRGRSGTLQTNGDHLMPMPVTTTFTIEGYRIKQYLGIVRGLIVRAPTITQGFLGGLKSIVGGNIGAYTEMC